MKISVIIPVYNTAEYLPRCLDSVFGQGFSPEGLEVVAVDDGSTDGCADILASYAREHPELSVIRQENAGLSVARNTGLSHACGDYVWFVDSDDYLAPGSLSAVAEMCPGLSPDLLAVGSGRDLDGSVQDNGLYGEALHGKVMEGREMMRRGLLKSVCAPFYVMRRNYLIDGGFRFVPGLLHEDEELMPRLIYGADKVAFLPRVCYYAFSRPGSITRKPNPKRSRDLITIAEALDSFSAGLPEGDRYLFSRRITDVLNEALKLTRDYPEETVREFQTTLYDKRRLLLHLVRSRRPRFVLEGLLMQLFPKRSIGVYRLLQGGAASLGLSTEKPR